MNNKDTTAKVIKPKKIWTCKLCNGDFTTGKGGVPKYCMSCLEELKDVYPFKKYYENRLLGGDIYGKT